MAEHTLVEKNVADMLKSKPWWCEYHDRLQSYLESRISRTHVVAFPDEDSCLESLFTVEPVVIIDDTDVISLDGKRGMVPGDCHNNVRKLFRAKLIEKVIYGYALSKDGLWRNHSWGLSKGVIIETTAERIAYIGVPI